LEGLPSLLHTGRDIRGAGRTTRGCKTLQDYCDWMKGMFEPIPNGRYELVSFATDEQRCIVSAYAVFHVTHSGQGGPIPPTGKKVATDYVYVM
jgi:predicted ester cyclase